jgi:4-amino-4-deoxy-L-arabinose transferase-like glycosyltransferase
MDWQTQRRLILPILIVLLGFALRVWDIDGRSLWLDEGMEYWVATSPIKDLPQNVQRGIQDPPLYSLLLHAWMQLGRDEFYLRFPSAVFSLMGIVGVIRLGGLLCGSNTGLVAGALMALLPTQIRYAQDVGQYALMGSLLVWNLIALHYVCERASWAAYLLWIVSALAATHSYYGTALPVLVTFGVEMIRSAMYRSWWRFARGLGALFLYSLCIMPLLLFFLPRQMYTGPTAGAFHIHFSSPLTELEDLATSTQSLIAFVFSGWPWTPVSKWVSSSVVAILLGQSLLKSRRSSSLRRWWLWLISTWGAYYVVSRLNVFPYGFRYALILVPLLVPAIASGPHNAFSERSWQAIGKTATVLIMLVCAVSLPNLAFRSAVYPDRTWAWPETEGLRQVVEYWLDNGGARHTTYVYYAAIPAFSYYLEQYGLPQDLPAVWYIECWQGDSSGYCARDNVYYGRWTRTLTPKEKVQSILETLSYRPRVMWLVFSHIYPGEDDVILRGLLDQYYVADRCAHLNAQLYLLERRDK